VAYEKVKPYQP